MKCENCQSNLTGKQTKWCCDKCKASHANNKHQNYQSQQKRGKTRKIKLIEERGGCCEICGYQKNIAALSFHHLDPSIKKFELDIRNLSNRKLDVILEEFKKCQLLCLNCHAELHNPRSYH